MRHFENRLQFQGPIEHVFDLAIDPAYWGGYMPWVNDVRDVHGRGDKVGDSARFTDYVLGRATSATTTVTAVERPVLQTTETNYDNGARMLITMHFTPAGDGTEVATTVDYELGQGRLWRALEAVTAGYVRRRMTAMGDGFARVLAALPA